MLRSTLFPVLSLSLLTAYSAHAGDLFNGRDLTGWVGDSKYWRVENGAIVGEIPRGQTLNKNTWLIWQQGELVDFDLRLEVRLTGLPAANSGIQFRCQAESVEHVSGYQADLDMGAVWLGRLYDEHGRALLVERGTRVRIASDGTRLEQTFAPAGQYAVLFRENDWNEYRIVAAGPHVAVYVNGTLFSELHDEQQEAADLRGQLAFQLHSGPQTKVEFRNIQLESLPAVQTVLPPFPEIAAQAAAQAVPGIVPADSSGKPLNLGFEAGDLSQWTAEGDAFRDQPVSSDGISQRWPGQESGRDGRYFIGGYEIVRDGGRGTLTSPSFTADRPWGSFLIGGGQDATTRAEVLLEGSGDQPETVLFSASGRDREQMRRVAVDLRNVQNRRLRIRLVDENAGGWGHLNFDDFRLHSERPANADDSGAWRSTRNPVLAGLVPNPVPAAAAGPAAETLRQMSVPPGFAVELVAAEPQLHQPMAFTFDAKGRIWVVEGRCYPQRRAPGEELDRILIFSDRDHDGSYETQQVFCEGLNLVSGLEVGYGGVWVGAAPQLLFIPDANGDDLPDAAPQVLLDGFDYADTHETLNSFHWGPDGWLYGNQGVFNSSLIGPPNAPPEQRQRLGAGVWRYHPQRHVFEVFAHGGSNQWGLDYDDSGQWFMTHCRSFHGRGGTTHVLHGGHYWNQTNSGYADFVSATELPGMPWMKNYLLASARYDHGEGGAGKPGTDAVYGGHSHVGTMIYLGDNWPDEYRNHLFTHNLHGHQINHQLNRPEAGGFRTLHAGQDVFFCGDRQYIGVDLQYGPDGAVYISDWYDPRHCHSPNTEQWDRGNGRLYRMKYSETWRPAQVDLSMASDLELANLQLHHNDWYVRTARRVLAERRMQRPIADEARAALRRIATEHAAPERRLRGLWALHAAAALDTELLKAALSDPSDYVRGWSVQLGVERDAAGLAQTLLHVAQTDSSLHVARCLASAVPRLPREHAWTIAEGLAKRTEIDSDRDLPSLLWFSLAPLAAEDPARGFELAGRTSSPAIRGYLHWYLSRTSDAGRSLVFDELAATDPSEVLPTLQLVELALRGRRQLQPPSAWHELGAKLYESPTAAIQGLAESIGAAFGDQRLAARLRERLQNPQLPLPQRRQAIAVLAADPAAENLSVLLAQLQRSEIREEIIPLLSQYDDPSVPTALFELLQQPQLSPAERDRTLGVLCGRKHWALALLDQTAARNLPPNLLSAFHIRQMIALGDPALTERINREWGSASETPAELQQQITQLASAWKSAPLWAFDAGSGRAHFQKLCAQCHLPTDKTPAIAPLLAGTSAKGIDYLVENLVNPNAVIGRDYQVRVVVLESGRVITGLVVAETPESLTIRTLNTTETVSRDEIEETRISSDSFMPQGLLKTLSQREQLELLKYVMGL